MPTKTPWLHISILLLRNFVKESQTRASYFQIYSRILRWISCVRNSGNFPFQTMSTDPKKASAASSKNYFLFIQNYHAYKMRSNYAGMKLPSALCEENKNKMFSQVAFPMQLQNRKFKVVNWEGTATKCTSTKMHVQSVQNCLFSNLNKQTVDVLFSIPVMVV